MNSSFAYLPQNERKKILLICDDIRVHSGVATVAREMVINTAQHFNWVQIAGAINHPDKGKRLDLSQDTNTNTGLTDASVTMYPADGYGDPNFVKQLISLEKPDAILLVTDPRYFMWLFQIENENGVLEDHRLLPGNHFHILPNRKHRMIAVQDCEVFEVSTPHLEDVVRLEDKYKHERDASSS